MKIIENWFRKILKKFSFTSFDRLRITFDRSSERETSWKISSHISINRILFWIDWMFLFNRSTSNWELIELDRTYVIVFFIFSIDQKFLLIDWMLFFNQSSSDRVSIELCRRFGQISSLFDRLRERFVDRMLWILNFSKCFYTLKLQGYVWWDYTDF